MRKAAPVDIGDTGPDNLTQLLALEPSGTDRFTACFSERNEGGEVFGGQYLGQALWAALATGGDRAPQAMTGWFLRAADATKKLEYYVERLRDGRSFSHRRVTATQDNATVFCADVSLYDAQEAEPAHQMAMPVVRSPDQLATLTELLHHNGGALGPQAPERIGLKRLVELRPVDAKAGILQPGIEPTSQIWLRVLRPGLVDRLMQFAILAYLSDYWSNVPGRLLHGRTLFSGDTTSASLNHGIWFHREPDVSGPLLYVVDSPSTYGGTSFNRGLLYHQDGRLLSSTTQEALMRRLSPLRSKKN